MSFKILSSCLFNITHHNCVLKAYSLLVYRGFSRGSVRNGFVMQSCQSTSTALRSISSSLNLRSFHFFSFDKREIRLAKSLAKRRQMLHLPRNLRRLEMVYGRCNAFDAFVVLVGTCSFSGTTSCPR